MSLSVCALRNDHAYDHVYDHVCARDCGHAYDHACARDHDDDDDHEPPRHACVHQDHDHESSPLCGHDDGCHVRHRNYDRGLCSFMVILYSSFKNLF